MDNARNPIRKSNLRNHHQNEDNRYQHLAHAKHKLKHVKIKFPKQEKRSCKKWLPRVCSTLCLMIGGLLSSHPLKGVGFPARFDNLIRLGHVSRVLSEFS
jgi:hypothetical protein